ncbi:hypothetical protein [Borreliella garinii]|nr:hypothetical protein [Borreliella garinii]
MINLLDKLLKILVADNNNNDQTIIIILNWQWTNLIIKTHQ